MKNMSIKIDQISESIEHGIVLHLFCGNGNFTKQLSNRLLSDNKPCFIIGVDFDLSLLDAALTGLYDQVALRWLSSKRLPLPDNFVHSIILDRDPDRLFSLEEEIKRVITEECKVFVLNNSLVHLAYKLGAQYIRDLSE